MLMKYLLFMLLANVQLAIGFYMYSPPKEKPLDQPCGCNGNFPNPTGNYNPYGQQNVMYIAVPVPVQGMYRPYIGGPAYMPPVYGSDYPSHAEHPPYPHLHPEPPRPCGFGRLCSQSEYPLPAPTELPPTNEEPGN